MPITKDQNFILIPSIAESSDLFVLDLNIILEKEVSFPYRQSLSQLYKSYESYHLVLQLNNKGKDGFNHKLKEYKQKKSNAKFAI